MNKPVHILTGDVLAMLATLPDNSVHCCVTSPPYYGLRDYGTGTWQGGNPDCQHRPSGASPDPKNPNSTSRNGKPSAEDAEILRGRCRCGAVKVDQQIGLEPTPEAFIEKMVAVFGEVKRVLRDDGTCWMNMGDSYNAGTSAKRKKPKTSVDVGGWNDAEIDGGARINDPTVKTKDLCMMPWRVALALQADGWWIRSVIVWAKKSPMPESVRDRPTSSWEPIFLMSKSERYYYDAEAVKESTKDSNTHSRGPTPKQPPKTLDEGNGTKNNWSFTEATWGPVAHRNLRNVWHLGPEPYAQAHFATFPTEIPRRAILAGTSEKGCCPECGAGWVRVVEKSRATFAATNDPTRQTGRKGLNRERDGQADRYVLAIPQHEVAAMIRAAANGRADEMRERFGSKWDHWIRTDESGARVPTFQDAEELHQMLGVCIPFDGKPGGWAAGCECNAGDPIPCTVLDPFLGSGTTLAVARQLGRHGVGIELNAEYVKLAEDRIGKAEKPHTYASKREDESPLFAGAPQ